MWTKLKQIFEGNKAKVVVPIRRQQSLPEERHRPGVTIGGTFRIVKKIGEGGFGEVYLVQHVQSEEYWAAKVYKANAFASVEQRDAFKKEALLLTTIGCHEAIVGTKWVQDIDGALYICLEYVQPDQEGRITLIDYLTGTPIQASLAVKWASQFCAGMMHVIQNGVLCHRDIKPQNIFIGTDGTMKIGDFGLALVAAQKRFLTQREKLAAELCRDAGMELSVTRRNESGETEIVSVANDGTPNCKIGSTGKPQVGGTPGYIAPEVLRGEAPSELSDIYSFGLVLWQMGTGNASPPFVPQQSNDIPDFLQKTYENQMRMRLPRIDVPYFNVIETCLQASPDRRPSSFGELLSIVSPSKPLIRTHAKRIDNLPRLLPAEWNNKGSALCSLGQYTDAIACFQNALAIDSESLSAWINLGVVYYQLNRLQESFDCLQKATLIDAECAMAWSNGGNVLLELGRNDQAMVFCEQAIELDPSDATAWSNKGNIFYSKGEFEKALNCYQQSVTLEPNSGRGWYNMSGCLYEMA